MLLFPIGPKVTLPRWCQCPPTAPSIWFWEPAHQRKGHGHPRDFSQLETVSLNGRFIYIVQSCLKQQGVATRLHITGWSSPAMSDISLTPRDSTWVGAGQGPRSISLALRHQHMTDSSPKPRRPNSHCSLAGLTQPGGQHLIHSAAARAEEENWNAGLSLNPNFTGSPVPSPLAVVEPQWGSRSSVTRAKLISHHFPAPQPRSTQFHLNLLVQED